MNLSTIIQLIIALPKVFGIIRDLLDMWQKQKQQIEEKKRVDAIEELKKAKTIEEVKNANQNITRNLP